MEERTWRDAKLPQWVKDSMQAETQAWELTAALSWPTEAKPNPVSFWWGDYDRLEGQPQEGVFWSPLTSEAVHIKRNAGHGDSWKSWAFSRNGKDWSTSVHRGPLFDNEHDARLYALWLKCEEFASKLMKLRRGMP